MKQFIWVLFYCNVAHSLFGIPRSAHVKAQTFSAMESDQQKSNETRKQLKIGIVRADEKIATEISWVYEQYKKLLILEMQQRRNGLLRQTYE